MATRWIIGCGCAAGGGYLFSSLIQQEPPKVLSSDLSNSNPYNVKSKRRLPSRQDQIKSLENDQFDVLVIGGGATGTGCALDAVTRGLKTALVDLDDFSSGTSSRSTKLIHGGIRYLQKAIMNFDVEQYRMVKEALNERSNLLDIAPHLSYPLPIMLPIYKYWQIPYFWMGIKMYDVVAGTKLLKTSYYLSKERSLELFPMLRSDRLKGALVYYDGAHNDARMCLSIALTATRLGGTIANHVKVIGLNTLRDADGFMRTVGAKVRDEISGKEFNIKARSVINATGPFTDEIRKMDNPEAPPMCSPSAGVHIVLPDYYSPADMGLLDPNTSDGRVIFFLPWQKFTIAGTTDSPCKLSLSPSPTEQDIQFILDEVKNYLHEDLEVRRGDVLSAWSGIRPLVSDPNKADTQSIARNHVVHVSPTGLVTIAGGKWTTYRTMASDAIDAAVQACKLSPHGPSQTEGLMLEGGHGYSPTLFIRLVQDIGLDSEVAKHLAQTYGDKAFSVAKMAQITGKRWPVVGNRIHSEFPYIHAEIKYAIREYAATAIDIIARRTRLAFLNVQAAEEALDTIIDVMGEELKWSSSEKKRQHAAAKEFLETQMGQNIYEKTKADAVIVNLTPEERAIYIKRFKSLDRENKGYISINDLRRSLEKQGERVSGEILHDILREIDTNRNGQVEPEEYLAMMTAIKSGAVVHSRFARMVEMEEERARAEKRAKISVERSGGGV